MPKSSGRRVTPTRRRRAKKNNILKNSAENESTEDLDILDAQNSSNEESYAPPVSVNLLERSNDMSKTNNRPKSHHVASNLRAVPTKRRKRGAEDMYDILNIEEEMAPNADPEKDMSEMNRSMSFEVENFGMMTFLSRKDAAKLNARHSPSTAGPKRDVAKLQKIKETVENVMPHVMELPDEFRAEETGTDDIIQYEDDLFASAEESNGASEPAEPSNEAEAVLPAKRSELEIVLDKDAMGKTVEKAVFQIQHGRKVATKAEKLHALQLHQLHLLSLIAHYEHINHVLNHKLVQAFALSTVPSSLIEALEDIDNVKGPITDLVDWIYHTFPVASDRPNSPSTPYTFLRLFTNSATNENAPSISYSTVPLICILVLRALGHRARLVCVLKPISHHANAKVDLSPSAKATRGRQPHIDDESIVHLKAEDRSKLTQFAFKLPAADPLSLASTAPPTTETSIAKIDSPPMMWMEYYHRPTSQWICEEPSTRTMGLPKIVGSRIGAENLAYVLAYEGKWIVDVMKRYSPNWSTSYKACPDVAWLHKTLSKHNSTLPICDDELERIAREEASFKAEISNEPPPTTVEGFKGHPIFVLERHIGRHYMIYPEETPSVGLFRGERYFFRKDLRKLHTREKWLLDGRQVMEGAVPVKRLQKITAPKTATESVLLKAWARVADEVEDLRIHVSDYFGEWQTEPYRRPVVSKDGQIPRNRFGNVYLFDVDVMLPEAPVAKPICIKHHFEFSEALAGWKQVGPTAKPVFDGIVVLERDFERINYLVKQEELHKAEQEAQKKSERAVARWRKFTSMLRIRAAAAQRVTESYRNAKEATVPPMKHELLSEKMHRVATTITQF